MGIYINGMEMPTSCQECPLKHRGFNGSETVHYCYAICKEVSDDGEIDADCPLVPIPPHGRLVDADALEASCFMGSSSFYTQSDIDYAPTVIPADPTEEGE